jgi:hypothetical protein
MEKARHQGDDMTEIRSDQERPAFKATHIHNYGDAILGPYDGDAPWEEIPEDGAYPILPGEIARGDGRGGPITCLDCDTKIDTGDSGWWTTRGIAEVPICNSCHEQEEEKSKGEIDLHEIPDSTTIWVSDLVDIATTTIQTVLDGIEADYRNIVIEQIRSVLEEYDDRGFKKGPLTR